jgi:hypothetical protein
MSKKKDEVEFWYYTKTTGNPQPKIIELYEFLADKGFRVKVEKDQNDRKELFRIDGHFIEVATLSDMEKEVIAFLTPKKKVPRYVTDGDGNVIFDDDVTGKFILEGMAKYKWSKIFDDKNFLHLPELQEEPRKHTRFHAYFYFKNGFVDISPDAISFKSYNDLSGHIYKHQTIDHEISIVENPSSTPEYKITHERGYSFLDFLNKISQVQVKDEVGRPINIEVNEEKRNFLFLLLGYLLHSYKQKGLTDWMPIFCDNNKGGSGKGILIDAIATLQETCVVDCQKEIPEHSPADLTPYTRVKVLDDLGDNFNLKQVFVEITGQTSIRQMYKPLINVPWAESWKLCGTSNKLIRGTKDKFLRRYKAFDLFPYFGKDHTLFDQYGHYFFSDDWDKRDYDFLYSLLFECCQRWLKTSQKGKGEIQYVDNNYQERFIEENYELEFRIFMNELEMNQTYKTKELYDRFIRDNNNTPFIRKMTSTSFGRKLTNYLEDMKIDYRKNHNRTEIHIGKPKTVKQTSLSLN